MNENMMAEATKFEEDDQEDLYEIMEGLEDTDGAFKVIVIHNNKIKAFMEKYQIINTGNRGSSWRGKNFELFQEVFQAYE